MPQVIPALATYFGVAAANTAAAIGASAALTASVYVAASTAFVYATDIFLLNKALGILNKRGKTGETRGLEVALTDSTASARVIYGEVRCSGVNIIPPVTSGTSGRYLHQILAVAVHEIDSYQTHYFEQDTLPAPASITGAAGDGAISSGTYSGAAWVRGYTGTMTQTVDWKLNNAFSSQWLSTARGRGFAYVAYTYDWGKGKVYKGVPQPTAKVRGAKVYDPRLDSTNGGSGSQRYTDTTTWTYSNNPALCWANYRIAAYGYGNDPATEVNWTTVAAAADICDALVANKDGTTSKRYTCNGVLINEPENLQDNEQKLIDSMLGRRTFVNGQWCIYAGAWTTPAWSIAATDWLSIESIDTVQGFEQGGRFNEVHCFFVNPSRNWQRVECYPRLNATYKSDDAGRSLPLEMEQPLCTDESEAQRKAEFILRASRNGIKLVGTLPPRFHGIKTYETVSLTFAELGWSSKTFRVIAMSLFMDGSVRVALSEEQDTDWTDLVLADYNSPSLSTIPDTNPTKPTAVTSLAITPLAGSLGFLWDEPVVRPINTRFQLIASVNSADASVGTVAWDGDANNVTVPWTDVGTLYWWYVRPYANSYFAPYYPNTYGTIGVPAISPHNARFPVVDPLFTAGVTVGSYWVLAPTSRSIINFTTPGDALGMYNGGVAVKVTCIDSLDTYPNIRPTRKSIPGDQNNTSNLFAVSPGQWMNLTLSYRRTTAVNSGATLYALMSAYRYPPGDIVYAATLYETYIRVDSIALNEWTHHIASVQVPTSSNYAFQKGEASAMFYLMSSGTAYIGQFDVTIK